MDRRRLQPADLMTKTVRRREKPRERWLLTRKTWKYMADAGRRLVPDGAQNRPEDIPRIEAYFQDVCAREPRFLLWRKSSYPGAIPKPRRKKRARGGSVRARSPSDTPPPPRSLDLHTSGGRFDIAKLRREFFAAPPPAPAPVVQPTPIEDEEGTLVDLLRKYLKVEEEEGLARPSESGELTRALGRYLSRQADRTPDSEATTRPLLDALSRYYGRASNRDHIVQDLLTDRGLLKRLYHDLRKTKPYRGGRSGGSGSGGYGSSVFASGSRGGLVSRSRPGFSRVYDRDDGRSPPLSPPPLIEVLGESQEDKFVDCGTQTTPIAEEVLIEIERAYRERLEAETTPTSPTSPPPGQKPGRRRSSVDHDDVSQSVSDTIKRYLRMARKKSVDSDKADRFKRINYDKNLRNIKPKSFGVFDDDGLSKGCQTEECWIVTYREGHIFSYPSSPPSPVSPTQPQSFLSSLLGRTSPAVSPSAGGMQKSRSSSSVVQSVSKRLWRTRSRSSSRVAAAWTPQGSCVWADGSGRCVRLTDTSILTLTEVERRALQQAALARLQQLNLGTNIKIPEDHASSTNAKPKRRAPLLKRKALTTGFFDQRAGKEGDKDKDSTSTTSVFGMPLSQCVDAERALRRDQHGSRTSLASLAVTDKDDSESCDSGEWGWGRLDEAGGGGPMVPGLISACLAHLRRHGLRTLGLFRVSASKKRVRQLREEWEQGQESALETAACPHDVATLLKEFLRDLPDPLLCRDLYQAFLLTQKIRNRRIQWEALQLVVQLLPVAHRDTLNALLSFLSQLAAHSEDDHQPGNKMDAANLATVFAPNILHRNKPNDSPSTEQLTERADVINVVRTLIERQAELWTLQADLLHEAYIHLAHTAPNHLDALLLRRAECSAERLSSSTPSVISPTTQQSQGTTISSTPGVVAPTRVRGNRDDERDRRVWSREEFLHGAAATGGPDPESATRRGVEKTYARTRRARDGASDSSGSLSSAMTIVTRVRSSVEESGVARTDPDCSDSASDYNETLGNSDSDSCVITASLHIPAAAAAAASRMKHPAPPPRRRSTSNSSIGSKCDSSVGSKRDSAVGSSPPSGSTASSPPASPPPHTATQTHHAHTAVTRGADIDRLVSLARERNTSDARAVVLRQHDENVSKQRERTRTEHTKTEQRPELVTITSRQNSRQDKQEGTLYKRGELISSARSPPP